jgi:hypothetical protein
MEFVKNPIIIGVFAGACTYAYLQWDINEKNKKKKNKKGSKKLEVNLIIPLVVTVIAWFIAYAYFEYKPESDGNTDIIIPDLYTRARPPLPLPIAHQPGYKFVKDVISESSEPRSFSLLTGGVTVPTKFPDVLLDMY